ncbi:MAG: triphosphoribosyl-dephospho-CoA synthase CitG [Eubacteriales bacterium]|nr:triphosphoribosyl-dephospho-CoA synthase CitG [Eubacteriales bacterium]
MMEVNLQEVLEFREKKAGLQEMLRGKDPCGIVISLGMNIPGPVKTGPAVYRAFKEGQQALTDILEKAGEILEQAVLETNAGYAAVYLVRTGKTALDLKEKTVGLEEAHALGRLFDIDVLDRNGSALTRELVGAERRRCLLCGGDAKECGRSRTHTVPELQKKVQEILSDWIADEIGKLAFEALLEELYTTPKPGLVDLYSCGAHRDMDVPMFERSAEALRPWFVRMAKQGFLHQGTPEELFSEIRKTGLRAEAAMYRATGGVNTHKGMIFTLGIFCAAAGLLSREEYELTQERLIAAQMQMTAETLKRELSEIAEHDAVSNGEKNLRKYGTTGVRGEAIKGYRSLTGIALPVLLEGIREGRPWNLIKLQTLFTLMQSVEDSNVLHRQDPGALDEMHREAEAFLKTGGAYAQTAEEMLREMDRLYIEKNLSPGGCADLLAAAIFLQFLLYGTKGVCYDSGRQTHAGQRTAEFETVSR